MARVNSNAGIPQPHFHLAVIGAGQAGLAALAAMQALRTLDASS
ncbi:hypothetical protein ACL1FL_00375 [Corynebacterium striatum]|nr:hypothetical protein [Corynebacterium striatum]